MSEKTARHPYSVLHDRYRIDSFVGKGGMASVYRAHDQMLGRDVAVKLFEPAPANTEELARQHHELAVLASLNHPSLVTLHDAGIDRTDPDNPRRFLVMELVKGKNLKEALAEGPMTRRQVAQLAYDLAEGLEYAHHHGVVHRDVKPANILLAEYTSHGVRTRAKLADFGIAQSPKSLPENSGSATGTAAYLSPEQARGEALGPASDVYSLGLVLLEALSGQPSFTGPKLQAAMARLLDDPEVPDDLPVDWRIVLTGMTSRTIADRPALGEIILFFRRAFLTDSARHGAPAASVLPNDEAARLAAVRRYDVLDTPADGTFDRITALAARLFDVPIAIVSIVDLDRIWFKSHHGLKISETGRDAGLCASAILGGEAWVVDDASFDPRAMANPLVAGEFGLRFYAGVPLTTRDGHNLGTLCVLDFEPRQTSPDELETLTDLAAMVMNELELRLELRRASGATETVSP
ncbi:serine/threonine protein kinase [Agreia sp. Leaf244]|uniref:protein kinase domain-containing protein n=1 Tax=Agreia sp. Leaf244 TaxID=1736305 RepID=UPI0006F82359|nr:protein kinase [Agreia sp. Leaf244]KQO11277.1 serine/threonine protein kinase [Agreia sp. Leaf244]